MGNSDGIVTGIINEGANKIKNFDGGYFSFAFGNEIALCLDSYDYYFIYNVGKDIWDKIKENITKKEAINMWLNLKGEKEISGWSNSFDILEDINKNL